MVTQRTVLISLCFLTRTLLKRKNLVCGMPCLPRQELMQRRRKLFLDFGRPLLPSLRASARRAASTLGLSGFQLARSITTWTLTLRLWARIRADVMLPLRTFHARDADLPAARHRVDGPVDLADQAADALGFP